MTDELAFLAAIADQPDDTVRLVYADWLDERNDPRALYVRLEVERRRLKARDPKRLDLTDRLDRLRSKAAPGWLSRIDRVGRFAVCWPPHLAEDADAGGRVGRRLTEIRSAPSDRVWNRGNYLIRIPKKMVPGQYLYVLATTDQTVLVVARMRVSRILEGQLATARWTYGVVGTEGTPIRFDLTIPPPVLERFTWDVVAGKRKPHLDPDGLPDRIREFERTLRLTPATAFDLDELLAPELRIRRAFSRRRLPTRHQGQITSEITSIVRLMSGLRR
jgi:uncharacterized protein (TIGR02996 family)